MAETPTNAGRVSPKVTTSTTAGALTALVAYLLGQLPYVRDFPAEVQAALLVLIIAAATFAGGYIKRDPARF